MESDRVKMKSERILSDDHYILKKYNFDFLNSEGKWINQSREAYDRGNGAAILLYNLEQQKVMLTRQFRLPTFINGNSNGMLLEACAGLLDGDEPEDCIRREAQEETGYSLSKVQKVFEAYTSPGAVTEILHFFIAEYSQGMKTGSGGGLDSEQEDIEVIEIDFQEAYDMIHSGEIRDAKTIMLLQYAKIHLFSDSQKATYSIISPHKDNSH